MRTVAIIQARMGSTRLPGKVAMVLGGRPMLVRVTERVERIPGLDQMVVATSVERADDRVEEIARSAGVACFRGPEDDVLRRFAEASTAFAASVIMRITADCPLLDPELSAKVLQVYRAENPDYASNAFQRTFPRGLDTEVFSADVLETADREATDLADREHVTRFVWRQPERFRIVPVVGDEDLSSHRWTVDTHEDLKLVRRIHDAVEPGAFGYRDTLEILAGHPDWTEINADVRQKKV